MAQAVRKGRLIRRPCELCGNPVVEGHHDDYGKPLDVRWLCHRHHRALHQGTLAAALDVTPQVLAGTDP